MSNEASAKILMAVFFVLAAAFLGINQAVRQSPLSEWALTIVLSLIGIGLLAWEWYERRMASESTELMLYPESAITEMPTAPTKRVSTSRDDLEVVEGIGPKIASVLVAAGIDTYAKLAQASEDDLRAALKAAKVRVPASLPTWAQQAALAAQDDWVGLRELKEQLLAGRKG
jgi:predicted flap endonuclease-1-like 5' DNA nuclease